MSMNKEQMEGVFGIRVWETGLYSRDLDSLGRETRGGKRTGTQELGAARSGIDGLPRGRGAYAATNFS